MGSKNHFELFNSEMSTARAKIVPSISVVSSVLTSYLRPLRHQFSHPQEIIGCTHKPSSQLRLPYPFKSSSPETSYGLYPAVDFFYSLPDSLADTVSSMSRRSPIDGRTTSPFGIGRHVRGDLSTTQKRNKTIGVISFIPSHSLRLDPTTALTFQHLFSRFLFRCAGGLRNPYINQKTIFVFHQGMRPITELGFFPLSLPHQSTLRISRRLVRIITPLLPMKVYCGISRIITSRCGRFISLPSKTLEAGPCFNKRSIHGEMVINPLFRACRTTASKKRRPTP